jgi:hypothetical protein
LFSLFSTFVCWNCGLWFGLDLGFWLQNDISLIAGQALAVMSAVVLVVLWLRRQATVLDTVFGLCVVASALVAIGYMVFG